MPAAAPNIDGALRTALGQLQDPNRPTYVVFLTDGIPTVGETNEQKIVAAAKEENKVHARIFVFGVGYDVNARFLDKLARECYGQSEYVRPDEDIEERVAKLYKRIQSPVLTGVQLQFAFDEIRSRGGQTDQPRLSQGLLRPVRRRAVGGGRPLQEGGHGQGGRQRHGRRERSRSSTSPPPSPRQRRRVATPSSRSCGPSAAWARSSTSWTCKGKNDELVKELVELSKRHGILTPYTSFMADEDTNLHDVAGQNAATADRLGMMEQTSGAGGVGQRAFKGAHAERRVGARGRKPAAAMTYADA